MLNNLKKTILFRFFVKFQHWKRNKNQLNNFKHNFYQFLNNDNMFIPDEKYLGLIIDLLLYLGEDLYIFTVPNNENELQLIGLKNINEIYV